jgi:hypothetical protein
VRVHVPEVLPASGVTTSKNSSTVEKQKWYDDPLIGRGVGIFTFMRLCGIDNLVM